MENETDALTRPLRDDEQPSRIRKRFDRVLNVFRCYETQLGTVNGPEQVAARRTAAATLTLAYFIAAAGDDAEHALNGIASSIDGK